MLRRVTASTLAIAGLFAMAALGQPPGGGDQKKGEKAKPADPADASIAKALANDPDVQVARAKVQLAEAEVAKAKQAVVLKVMTLQATIKEQQFAVGAAEQRAALAARGHQSGTTDQQSVLEARAKLETAKAALARTEAELKLLTGGAGKEPGEMPAGDPEALARRLEAFLRARGGNAHLNALDELFDMVGRKHTVQGPIPDRIREALDKKVSFGAVKEMTLDGMLSVFNKEVGLNLRVRTNYPKFHTLANGQPLAGPNGQPERIIFGIEPNRDELSIGAWFQLFEDQCSFLQDGKQKKCRFYVRDYGILFTTPDNAPPDAPTLTEFWKQKPPEAQKDTDTKETEAMLKRLKREQVEMSVKFGPDHPEMVAIQKLIEQLEKELKDREQPKK